MEESPGTDAQMTRPADERPYPNEQQNFLNSETQFHSQLHVEFTDLCYSVCARGEKPKEILHNVTGCFRAGKLTAILGPSGAGKSTLLGILSTLKSVNVKGAITINGVDRDGTVFRKNSCLIPQEFALLPLLTAKETLYIAARLKLRRTRRSWSPDLLVDEIMGNLGLTHSGDTLVKKLSGGERKRLSIGIEIITKPLVLLLDEPTSGLDSSSSYQVISMLNAIAKTGCTVACAIHQPSCRMISKFDDILVLERGRSYYCGPSDQILDTFVEACYMCPQFYNIAEFVLEVVTGQRGGSLENLHKISRERYNSRSAEYSRIQIAINSAASTAGISAKDETNRCAKGKGQRLSVWQEQKVLFLRALLCVKRDNTMTKLRLAAHVAVALLLGTIFYDCGNDAGRTSSNIACVFFILLFLYFSSSMPAVQMFPTEAAVFLREYLNNWYRLPSYYIVKILSDLPLQILCPTCFISIIYYMTGQPMEHERFFQIWAICVLMTILGQSTGILTGVAFNTDIGVFLIPALSMPVILFAGFFIKISELPFYLRPFSSLSFFRYAFEGILQTMYSDRDKLPCSKIFCLMRSPAKILHSLEMPIVSYHTNVSVLSVWIICLHLLIFSVLKWKSCMAEK